MGSLLNAINFTDFFLLETGYEIGTDALGQFAKIIIEGIGILGLGIIVFALVLKAIVLPFDIYQRVKMRKQTLIMREMQPELEKLQKQYANDKAMYNQKMMELYKKNGYSMFAACLPMIISMVILIIAFQGFRAYSTQANLNMYVGMSEEYNRALAEYVVDGKDYHLPVEGQDPDELTIEWEENQTFSDGGLIYTMLYPSEGSTVKYLRVEAEDVTKCIFYQYAVENGTVGAREYKLDLDRIETAFPNSGEEIQQAVDGGKSREIACRDYVKGIGALAVRDWYKGTENTPAHNSSFLWIKNVWFPDVSYQHPIQDYDGFSGQFSNVTVTFTDGRTASLSAVLDKDRYEALTMGLNAETQEANGYFILIILSIGLMVLSQFLSMRSQKESNKYQTVDGSGAKTQKIMLIMMPLIYAVFAFMYSAAFSIYMVMSSFISILTTLIANLIIGRIFKKKEAKAFQEKHTRILPWMNQDGTKKGKKDRK